MITPEHQIEIDEVAATRSRIAKGGKFSIPSSTPREIVRSYVPWLQDLESWLARRERQVGFDKDQRLQNEVATEVLAEGIARLTAIMQKYGESK